MSLIEIHGGASKDAELCTVVFIAKSVYRHQVLVFSGNLDCDVALHAVDFSTWLG